MRRLFMLGILALAYGNNMNLSVVILARNEAKRLQQLLPVLGFASEVVIIDDYSTDATADVGKKHGARVYKHHLHGDYAGARNVGLMKAVHEWVLFLDADETPTEALVQEIKVALKSPRADGYFLNRRDVFLGNALRHGETGHMSLLRLGKKSAGKWVRPVHEVWQIAKTSSLNAPLLHESHTSFGGFMAKIRRYAKLEARYKTELGVPFSITEMIFFPLAKFLYSFVWQKGMLDGWRGFLMSVGMSYHSFLARWYRLPELSWGSGWLRVLMLIVLLCIPFGQLLRVQLTNTISIYLFEVLMALACGWWVLQTLWQRLRIRLTAISRSLLVFSAVLSLSLIINIPVLSGMFVSPLLYLARLLLYVAFYVVGEQLVLAGNFRLPFKRLLVWIGALLVLVGLGQYVFWPDTRFLYYLGWDDHYYRLIGAYLDPAFTGLMLVLTLVVLEFRRGWMSRAWYTCGLLALALTFSRSSYVVFAAVMIFLAWRRKAMIPSLVKLFLLGLLVVLIPKPGGEGVNLARTYSVESRAESVTTGWDVVRRSPLFGVGFNAYREVTQIRDRGLPIHPSSPDNSFVLALVTSGLMGLATYIALWFTWLKVAWKNQMVFTSLIAIGLHSFTNNSFFYPFVLLWMFVLWWEVISNTRA
jgi:glycosyltransferase involved in cell wall biosynthesis